MFHDKHRTFAVASEPVSSTLWVIHLNLDSFAENCNGGVEKNISDESRAAFSPYKQFSMFALWVGGHFTPILTAGRHLLPGILSHD
jgi:hypothetical protein